MIRLAIKDIKLMLADRRALLLTFFMPMALITLFAFMFGGVGAEEKAREYELNVADLDSTETSRYAISQLDSQKTIRVVQILLENAQEDIRKGKRDAILIFHKGFSDSLENGTAMPVELQYDEAKEAEVGMLQQALFSTLAMLPFSQPGNIQKSMYTRFDKMLGSSDSKVKNSVHVQFDSLFRTISSGMESTKDTEKDQGEAPAFSMAPEIVMTKLVASQQDNALGLIHAVAGTAIMMLLFSVAGMGGSLLDEKQEGTLKKLLYSPLRPNSILFGKMISTNIVSVAQLSIMFIYAKVAFGLDILHHLPSLALMILATAYACSSFGVFLASFAKSRSQVQGLSTLLILVMSCIGGSMVPTFVMPEIMQKISVFSVNYWGIQGFYDIFWRLLPMGDTTFLSRIYMLLIIGSAMNLVALRMFNKNILKIA